MEHQVHTPNGQGNTIPPAIGSDKPVVLDHQAHFSPSQAAGTSTKGKRTLARCTDNPFPRMGKPHHTAGAQKAENSKDLGSTPLPRSQTYGFSLKTPDATGFRIPCVHVWFPGKTHYGET